MNQQTNRLSILLVIGLVAAGMGLSYVFTNYTDKEAQRLREQHIKELEITIKEAEQRNVQYDSTISKLERQVKQDSIAIQGYTDKIKRDQVATDKRLVEALKMTNEEKRNYILDRFK